MVVTMKSRVGVALASVSLLASSTSAFVVPTTVPRQQRGAVFVVRSSPIVSPFDNSSDSGNSDGNVATYTPTAPAEKSDGPLDLTWDNVEMVLDGMRPYLIQDGGNVVISEIDGPVVRLELQGACGTCPSSTQTMKMGLERGLRERIPEIQEVVQSMPEGPDLNKEQVDVVLDGVRPFLQVAGGSIELDRIEGLGGLQPTIWLNMEGNSASLNSVKSEIAQRLQRHFMMAGLQVQWVGE